MSRRANAKKSPAEQTDVRVTRFRLRADHFRTKVQDMQPTESFRRNPREPPFERLVRTNVPCTVRLRQDVFRNEDVRYDVRPCTSLGQSRK